MPAGHFMIYGILCLLFEPVLPVYKAIVHKARVLKDNHHDQCMGNAAPGTYYQRRQLGFYVKIMSLTVLFLFPLSLFFLGFQLHIEELRLTLTNVYRKKKKHTHRQFWSTNI